MRRFLDWTAAQTAGQQTTPIPNSIRRNSHQARAPIMTTTQASIQHQQQTDPIRELEIQHLIKLLHEIKYYQASSSPLPSAASSQSQKEFVDKVHRTIPLFLKVFENNQPNSALGDRTRFQSISSDHLDYSESHNEQSTNLATTQSASSKPNSPLPPKSPQMEKFPDLLPFAFTVARLFVSEVRQRASNKHAEDASLAILQFLNSKQAHTSIITNTSSQAPIPDDAILDEQNPPSDGNNGDNKGDFSPGWNLLLSLNTLVAAQSSQIVQLLCDASLPSTLIKCLYLFFDLPTNGTVKTSDSAQDADNYDNNNQSTLHRNSLIKAFTQLLVQLCSNQTAINELIKKDDLRLLIGLASSQCLKHNNAWRKTAFQTLIAISKNMRDSFFYLEQNICIQVYVENMHRINSLGLVSIEEYIDMIKILIEFLYNLDVNNRNQPRSVTPLIDQFRASRIMDLIEELILKLDDTIMQEFGQQVQSSSHCTDPDSPLPTMSQQLSISSDMAICTDEYRKFGRKLMQSLTVMAKINVSQDAMTNIVNLKPLTTSRFEMFEQFRMLKPSAKNCILNYEVLRLFKMIWSKCRDNHIIEAILDATISLFNDDKYNYFIFESQQLLVYYMTSHNFKTFPFKVKQKLFKFLEFIIIETNYIPCLELGTLGTIISKKETTNSDLILCLRTLIACLRFNSKFSDIFREIGLLEVIVELLIATIQKEKLIQGSDNLEILYLLLETSQYLLNGPNNLNCVQFNESGAARHVFNCLSKPEFFHLFVPAQGSSSDDGGCSNVPGNSLSRANTPPISAHSRSQHFQHTAADTSHYKPSIKQLQKVAFTIIRQLILSTAGDEHLANLLGLLARNLDDLKNLENSDQDKEITCESSSSTSRENRLNFAFLISQEVNLKICILKSLMIILKDSHRCRTLFRKAGGFIYIVSSLVTLEKSLSSGEDEDQSQNRWRRVNSRRIWRLIKNSLITIVVAMRHEPANVRAFSDDILNRFTEALRNLGCFRQEQKDLQCSKHLSGESKMNNFNLYKTIFLAPPTRDLSTIANESVKSNEACCQLFRFLYDMSLDMGDATNELEVHLEQQKLIHRVVPEQLHHQDMKSMSFDQEATSLVPASKESSIFRKRSQLNMAPKRPPSLDLEAKNAETAILTFPCIIISILDLIPSCPSEDLMIFMSQVVKSLFKVERNLQLLCEVGMISKLLSSSWNLSITDKSHYLYQTSEFMLEKLTKQVITPKELRMFLRLNDPLKCKNLDEIQILESSEETRQKLSDLSNNNSASSQTFKEKVITHRIEALIAMMTNEKSQLQPPYVEFDMSVEGFSSIFMPSVAPINIKSLPVNSSYFLNSTLDIHANEKNGILGGVGALERAFPPTTGLTFSSWFCVNNFPSRSSDSSHNLRLLTIYRGSASTGKEYSCFRIQISALDRALTVSTQEVLLFDNDNRADIQHDPDCNMRIWTPELLVEGKWHHLVVTMNRSAMKQSRIHVYVDGVLVHHQRICYISNFVGTTNSGPLGNTNANNASSSAAAFVNAFIGSLPQYRFQLRTQWKQGPCHLLEESIGANFVSIIYTLGPNFIGNFQNAHRLNELAKSNLIQQTSQHEVNSQQSNSEHTSAHKQLTHQQSLAVVGSHHSNQIIRVSSSNVGSSSSSSIQQTGSSNQYHVVEDRVLVGLDARAASFMTLPRMRRIYTRFDCRQISRVLGLAMHESSTPILLLHNTGVHLNGPSRGIGAITIGHNHVRCFVPSPTQQTIISIGGCYILLGLVAQSQTKESFFISLNALVCALKHNNQLEAQMENINGYQILSVFFWKKKHLLSPDTLELTFSLITETTKTHNYESTVRGIQQVGALRDLVCECFDLWLQIDMINQVLEFIYDLICSSNGNKQNVPSNSSRVKNLKCLRDMDLLPRMLRLLPKYDSQQVKTDILEISPDMKDALEDVGKNTEADTSGTFDTKAVYLIKQTVFELLNRTPRQTDILYFGQFLASLLPYKNKERSAQTISLRNILLKSLLQMMTKNKQVEVNNAMQEELVRILGFDWFMLFISGSDLDSETTTLGFLNLMIILSNDDLYENFKNKKSKNGGWLKEPIFPSMDGKSNIQLLGINVGIFFGLSGKRKSIRQEILDAPNYFLLSNFLTNLIELPKIYLMIFQTMMSRFTKLDSSVLDTIETFDKLNLDILCDSLVGDTHHKRRQTLANIEFRCHELVVCLVYMIRDIIWHPSYEKSQESSIRGEKEEEKSSMSFEKQFGEYPTDIVRFLMYLYNNNRDFQQYCRRSDELIDALCATLYEKDNLSSDTVKSRRMTQHAASKEILELSRLIILDTMTDPSQMINGELSNTYEQLHAFERFLESLKCCKDAQGELVDMLLRQILLMIDSTARQNSIKTIGSSENIVHFQLLLTNSILISQIVTDKIWLKEIYTENLSRILTIIDHQLCLAEQIFKFNELLPKSNPPHAFIMQRNLNRILLFALSRPMQHMSDKILLLDLLKKIHDNRTIIILNHMHSPQSAEFFVCFAYCLTNIIEDNSISTTDQQPSSMIERQYGHPSIPSRQESSAGGPSSTALMLVSMARKVWDAIYQSKKGIMSEAFDVSLSLPAFTLDTSLDLIQLKPDIYECCARYWLSFIENEQKQPAKRLQQRQSEPPPGTSASTAVNILSGRLTKVVNAASFVSRVVGATAGTMASNVNLVGEKLTQTRGNRRDSSNRTALDGTNQTAQQSSNSTSSYIDQSNLFKLQNVNKAQIEEASKTHISIIDDFIESQLTQKNHKLALHKYLCDEWMDTEYEVLLRERAIFGPDYGSKLDKWCLDITEGPRRMRKKMVNNTIQFYDNYPYRPDQYNPSNKSLRYRPPMSYDSHLYYLKTVEMDEHLLESSDKSILEKTFKSCIDDDVLLDPVPVVAPESSNPEQAEEKQTEESIPQKLAINIESPPQVESEEKKEFHSSVESLSITNRLSAELNHSPKPSEGDLDDGDSTSFVDFNTEIEEESNSAKELENIDSLSVLRLLEKNERISHMFRCSRVQGLDTYEGLLLFGREHFYLIDGFTLLKTREIKDIDSLPPDAHDPIIPNSTPNILAHSKKTCSKFAFDSVVEVHKRRYLLQPIALEVFSFDGRNTLIVFPRNIRNKVYSRLMTLSTQLTNNASESLAGQKSNVSVEGGSGLLSNLIGETSVTQRWVRGELSNFQYLMNLNTIAGRSYNDLMQYPIFPWILADYTSDSLDLTKPSTFRDLSRPVGAQTSERLEQFKRRYADWDDLETPPYHYGTFYSSAMIVASYMVRMEPFTQHFLRLQGGHFDLADRMFHSIQDSWLSASKHNMADIKELVPEFFYLPEFLKNSNKFDLGIKQSGKKLDDVILPPWAKGDTREFIRLHRCALESDYVSAHLHEWIDLIFGYKQQGQAAIDAVNVFHHLFYEGNVDIYNTDIDPIKKNAVIGFINNFGQVPKQLFKKPHPARKVTSTGFTNSSNALPLTPILPSLTAVSSNYSNQKILTHNPHALKQANSTFKDLRGPVGQIVQIDKSIVAVEQNKLLIPPEYCRYVAWGHADRSIRLGLYDSEKPIFVWEGSDIMSPNEILCCTIPNSRIMITAGTESVITVWRIEKMKSLAPMLNLYGHVEPVTCLASSQSYSLIVSGSRDRTAIIWDLNRFTFVRQLGGGKHDELVHHGPISAIAINDSTGDIATCALSWLYLWTINGELLAQIDSQNATVHHSMPGLSGIGQLHILSVCFSQYNEWDSDEVILTGASDGSLSIWSMRYYQSPIKASELKKNEEIEAARLAEDEKQQQGEPEQDKTCSLKQNELDNNINAADEAQAQENVATNEVSEPISIRGRKRTDTMNSDWVKLSTSSTSTIETIPRVTPNSLNDNIQDTLSTNGTGGEDSLPLESASFFPQDKNNQTEPRLCSTPASNPDLSSLNVCDQQVEDASAANSCAPDSKLMGKTNSLLMPSSADPTHIKFSKSDTSLVDSFVILGDSAYGGGSSGGKSTGAGHQIESSHINDRIRPQSSAGATSGCSTQSSKNRKKLTSHHEQLRSKLLPNHCWRRELYLRAILPKRGGKNPAAAITSLTISKDHRTVFIGDATGKVTSWTTL